MVIIDALWILPVLGGCAYLLGALWMLREPHTPHENEQARDAATADKVLGDKLDGTLTANRQPRSETRFREWMNDLVRTSEEPPKQAPVPKQELAQHIKIISETVMRAAQAPQLAEYEPDQGIEKEPSAQVVFISPWRFHRDQNKVIEAALRAPLWVADIEVSRDLKPETNARGSMPSAYVPSKA